MTTDLHKLRIDKSHKVRRDSGPRWPWAVVIGVLGVVGLAAYRYQQAASVVPVEVVRVHPVEASASQAAAEGGASDLVVLNATGYIMAAHKVELASKVVGRVAWVGVEMGDKVKAGQVLVKLEDDEYRARVAQQQGQLDAARARLRELEAGNRPQEIAAAEAQYQQAQVEAENAARNYRRLVEIRSTRTQSEIDDAEAQMKSRQARADYARQQYELMKAGSREEVIAAQKATVAQLEGVLALAADDLKNTVIRAPQDSTILERNVEVGEFVTTGFVGDRGAKGYVVSIADLSDLLVELDISQNDFAKVSSSQPCWITTDAYPDRKYAGVVQLISPVANRQKATIEVRVKITQPDDLLKPDMNATVSFLSTGREAVSQAADAGTPGRPVFRVPKSALRNNELFIVEEGKAKRIGVTPGLAAANGETEIRKGLIGGEEVILHPPETLKDGDAVKIQTMPE
jgi:HlyD family secretion protein